ncbi:MAG: TonB-dependent receptor plug domain-containing protein [Thermodesulfobacteriota bacterium]
MKNLIRTTTLVIWLGLFLPGGAGAEEKKGSLDYQVFQLGEIVITGPKTAGSQTATVSTFTAQDIKETHSLTVPEALSYVPGVSVTTGFKNEPDIRIHGFQQYEALILIDGVPYYESNYGKLNLNQLPTDMIARIDVIKGAPSVLYGPGAMGGVINIITKTATDRATFTGTGEAGSNDAYHLSATHGNQLGKFKYWLNFSRRGMDSWPLAASFDPQWGDIVKKPGGTTRAVLEDGGKRNNSDLEQTSLWGKVGLDLGPESKIYLSSYFLDSSWAFPVSTRQVLIFPNRPAFSRFARMDKYRDFGLDVNGEHRINDALKLRSKFFYHNHIDAFESYADQQMSRQIATSTYQDYILGGSLFADLDLVSWDTLRGAFHFRGDSHQERDDAYLPYAASFSYTGSLALENELRPLEGLSIITGLSYDWFKVDKAEHNLTDKNGNWTATENLPTSPTKDAWNPMVGVSYSFPDQTRLYGSVARKTRFPTLQQLFSSKGGNIELNPQRSLNYTLGLSRPFGKMAFGEASVFCYDIKDRISRDAPYPDAMYHNYANVRIYGFELTGKVTPYKDLDLRLGYTLLHARDKSPDRVITYVVGVPKHKVDLGVNYRIPRLHTRLHLEGLFQAGRWDQLPTPASPDTEALRTGSFFLVNFRIAQPLGDHFEAFAFLSNLFDKNYESQSGFPGPGRTFWLGLNAKY